MNEKTKISFGERIAEKADCRSFGAEQGWIKLPKEQLAALIDLEVQQQNLDNETPPTWELPREETGHDFEVADTIPKGIVTVPFHEADLEGTREHVVLTAGRITDLNDGRRIEIWHIKDDTGICVRIFRPTRDGKTSKLLFGLELDAAYGLKYALDAALTSSGDPKSTPAERKQKTSSTVAGEKENQSPLIEALRKIADDFEPSEKIMQGAERLYGLSPAEALEMAYDNIQDVAVRALAQATPVKKEEENL